MRSCFNAFSRVDVRVDVKIPGGVNAYVIDLRGERYVPIRILYVPVFLVSPQPRSNCRDLAGDIRICFTSCDLILRRPYLLA